ncbi:MAG: TonB-dependent receptor plug domain-containing protein [Fulvivirga sp.]|nr:TonB-dependent receptor plug domain-containing protein [Fulvivirga sp.]
MIRKLPHIFFMCLLAFDAHSQEEGKEIPLQKILQSIERTHQVSFTYADENVEGVRLVKPADSLNLTEKLTYLENNTSLRFNRLNDRFIAIQKKETSTLNIICGYAEEQFTGEPIQNAVVRSMNNYTITDDQGYFELKIVPEDSLVAISFLGYLTATKNLINFQKGNCPTIPLQSSPLTLQEVIIKNYLTEGIKKQLNGSFLLDTEELGILPGLIEPDVLQTVQALPGIQSIDESVADINVRGGTNDQNLVMWNGIRMYQTGHFFGLISAFNPYLTDDVTLIKNGSSALFGSSVSSTMLINSDDDVAKEVSGSAGINMINGDLQLKIPVSSRSSLQLSSRRAITDLVALPTYNQYFERIFSNTEVTDPSNQLNEIFESNESFYFYDVSARYLHNISDKDKLSISFLDIYNDLEYLENAVVNNKVESRTSTLEQENLAAGIDYQRYWSDKIKSNVHLKLSSYNLSAVNFDIRQEQRLEQRNEVLDLGLAMDTRFYISKNFDLLAGYQLNEIGVTNFEDINNPDFFRLEKEVLIIHAGLLEGFYTSDDEKTAITLGVRTNYYDKLNQTTIEPRLSFNQKITSSLHLEMLGEMKSQATAQIIDLQNDFLGVEKRRWVLANNSGMPLTQSKQISAGLTYDKKEFLANFDAYYKEVDGISSSSQGFLNQFQFTRSNGAYTSSGFDLLLNKKFKSRFNTWLSYSYAKTIYEFPEFQPAEFPSNLDIRHIITLGGSFTTRKFEASLGLNWRTGKPFTLALSAEGATNRSIVYDQPNNLNLSDYVRVDASVKYNFPINENMKAQLGASVWNLTDHNNILSTYYNVNQVGELQQINKFALGFTPNISVRIIF